MNVLIVKNRYKRIVSSQTPKNFGPYSTWITRNKRYFSYLNSSSYSPVTKNAKKPKSDPYFVPDIRYDSFGYPYIVNHQKKTPIWALNAEQFAVHPIILIPIFVSVLIIIGFIIYYIYMLLKGILIVDYFYPSYAGLGICGLILIYKLWRRIWSWLLTKDLFLNLWDHELILGARIVGRVMFLLSLVFAMVTHIILNSEFDYGCIGLHYDLTPHLRKAAISDIGTIFVRKFPEFAIEIKKYLDANITEVYGYFNVRMPEAKEHLTQILDNLVEKLQQAELEKAAKETADAAEAADAIAKQKELNSKRFKEAFDSGLLLGASCLIFYLCYVGISYCI